ncbi:MAG: lysine--tRNA ligase [Chloroflexota bacterium]
MSDHDDYQQLRGRKLQELGDLGLPLLDNRYGPTRHAVEIRQNFEVLDGSTVRVAGRLMRVRLMGKASFAHVQDVSGEIQLYFKRDDLGEPQYQYFKLLDIGDIIGAEGRVFKTRTGEVSLHVERIILLAKAYLPLPDKFHGLADVETRYRQRYLDLIANEEARRVTLLRSQVVRDLRRYLDDCGFVEVETPILQTLYGGAAATPFVTRYEALDTDVYLRIADELYLKRLIVGGMERVYEIAKDFRNENFSRKHSPEFTMLELYQAYGDYSDMMTLLEDMLSSVSLGALGSYAVTFDGHDIDLTPPWRRLSLKDAMKEYANLDLDGDVTTDRLLDVARAQSVTVQPDTTRGKLIEDLFSALVEPNLIQPTFVYDYPVDFPGSLLAKRRRDDPNFTERFEMFVGGLEVANAFTELNDPYDQRARMIQSARLRGDEYQNVDTDYITALEHGMPPTGGLGFGIDRLVMILAGAHHIRETILFPLLRPREASNAES